MIRSLVLVALALLFHSVEAGLSVALGRPDLPVVPGVVLLVYAILVEPTVEATVSALALGFVMDALSGTPLGMHMMACLLTLIAARFFADTVSSPRTLAAFFFAMGCSAAYHTIAILLLVLFAG
ncbi:MAG: rod shape-determining protein MreD, partial [Deltaproteobacteria bacterium]|nr:rod shape-determining protein MreD [Deltaproteobacteria bacterium]